MRVFSLFGQIQRSRRNGRDHYHGENKVSCRRLERKCVCVGGGGGGGMTIVGFEK